MKKTNTNRPAGAQGLGERNGTPGGGEPGPADAAAASRAGRSQAGRRGQGPEKRPSGRVGIGNGPHSIMAQKPGFIQRRRAVRRSDPAGPAREAGDERPPVENLNVNSESRTLPCVARPPSMPVVRGSFSLRSRGRENVGETARTRGGLPPGWLRSSHVCVRRTGLAHRILSAVALFRSRPRFHPSSLRDDSRRLPRRLRGRTGRGPG